MNKEKIIDFFFDSTFWQFQKDQKVWEIGLPYNVTKCNHIEIASYSIPTYNSVTSGYNSLIELPADVNTISFNYMDQNGTPYIYTIGIPAGYYTLTSIVASLNSQIQSLMGSIATITFGVDVNNYLTFSVSSSQSFGLITLFQQSLLSDLLQLSLNKIYLTFGNTTSMTTMKVIDRNYLRWYTDSYVHYSINDGTPFLFTPSSGTLTYLQWGAELVVHMKASATSLGIDYSGMTFTWTGTQFRLQCTTGSGTLRWSPAASNDSYLSSSILSYLGFPQNQRKNIPGNFTYTPTTPFVYQIYPVSDCTCDLYFLTTSSSNLVFTTKKQGFSIQFLSTNTLATHIPAINTMLNTNYGFTFSLASLATTTNGEILMGTSFSAGLTQTMAYLNIDSTLSTSFYNHFGQTGVQFNYGDTTLNRISDNAILYTPINYDQNLYLCSSLANSIYTFNENARIMFNILYGMNNSGTLLTPFLPELIKFTPSSDSFTNFSIFILDKDLNHVNFFGQRFTIHFRFYCNENN